MTIKRCMEVILLLTAFILTNSFNDALWLRILLIGVTLLYVTNLYRNNEMLKILISKRLHTTEDEDLTRTERFQIILNPLGKSLLTVILLQTPFLVYSTFIQGLSFSCGIVLLGLELRKEYVQEHAYYLKE